MKNKSLLLGLILAITTALGAQPAPASDAQRDSEAVIAIWKAEPPAGLDRSQRAFWEWQDEHFGKYSEAGRAFAAKYPANPLRYNFLVQASFTRPWFIKGFKPEFDDAPSESNLIVDQPALDAFRASQAKYLTEVIEASDAEDRHRGGAFFALLADARGAARDAGRKFDITVFRPLADRVVAKFGDARVVPVLDQYLTGLRYQSPEAAAAYEKELAAHPAILAGLQDLAERRKAEEAQLAAGVKARATEIGSVKFTAADGREVDLAKLKGKVVLIDFWATWCGPCVAEIPNVVANYNKYHDKGFEVVGITLENPGFAPKDTEEGKTAKLATAKQKMQDYTKEKGMPWPQYFDGKWWKNDYAVKFGIAAIPAMFLLDQQGNIVSTEARGPKLEAELKRLLKL